MYPEPTVEFGCNQEMFGLFQQEDDGIEFGCCVCLEKEDRDYSCLGCCIFLALILVILAAGLMYLFITTRKKEVGMYAVLPSVLLLLFGILTNCACAIQSSCKFPRLAKASKHFFSNKPE